MLTSTVNSRTTNEVAIAYCSAVEAVRHVDHHLHFPCRNQSRTHDAGNVTEKRNIFLHQHLFLEKIEGALGEPFGSLLRAATPWGLW